LVPNTAALDIARSYREVRVAIESREYSKAATGFSGLLANPAVQEPSRTWAGVEAVITQYLDARSSDARAQAKVTSAHARGLAKEAQIDSATLEMLDLIVKLPAVPSERLDKSASGPARILTWMLAALKNWEQGKQAEAVVFFSAVADAKLANDESWLAIYQTIAKDYLVDFEILSDPAFATLPVDVAGCEAAVARLEDLLGKLKTRGRSRFNLRAWQLDLTRHAKLLAVPEALPEEPSALLASPWDQPAVLGRLAGFAEKCQFAEASAYLKSLAAPADEGVRTSLLAVTDASQVFLTDLRSDLAKGPATGDFVMKSGETVKQISLDPAGGVSITDAGGVTRIVGWNDFSPDALIVLHRIFVKNPKSETERVRRHQCAISFDWLTGNRERALAAASLLAQGSDAFKQHWDLISGSLPK
jgi:hypothetical protein